MDLAALKKDYEEVGIAFILLMSKKLNIISTFWSFLLIAMACYGQKLILIIPCSERY